MAGERAEASSGNGEASGSGDALARSLEDAAYWRELLGGLRIDDGRAWTKSDLNLESVDGGDVSVARRRILDDGYCQVSPGKVCALDATFESLRRGVEELKRLGWHASFIFLYDEAWVLAGRMAQLMRGVSGNEISYDMLAWHVDHEKGESGFSPHRDRQPDNVGDTFRSDGMAKYATCWLPLTRASPENSCLYVIPRRHDPGYERGDFLDGSDADPLAVALHRKEAYQHITALPTEAGGCLLFTHRIIHWGSSGRMATREEEVAKAEVAAPRVSVSIGFSDPTYERPYLRGQPRIEVGASLPPFRVRLALICAQMISYFERFPTDKRLFARFYKVFASEADLFDEAYVTNTKEVREKEREK